MRDNYTSRLLLLVSVCAVWEALAKSLPDQGAFEVQIKVQVFDSSDLSPLADAHVQVHGNQTVLVSSRAGSDGVLRVNFLYRTGTWVIITASKQDYVTNSVPWHSSRIPLYASVSLYLLVQRPGTLILYDDVLQVLSGSPGARNQPVVQLHRKSLQLPSNSNYTALSAVMTTARSQYEIGGFPFLLGQETNSSGAETGWTDLTAVAVVSIQLFDKDGVAIQVSDPIHISVPLPSDTRNRMATSVPAWLFQPKTGLWVKTGVGYIKKEGAQFVWNVVVPQMGYWLAAFPTSSGLGLSHPGMRDITTYHTLFLLSILGSLALLVLILLCVLLYYCRRKCLKPRRQQGKPHASNLNGAKRDQGTSMSRLNLICGGHAESGPSNDKSDMSPSRDYQSSREDLTKHVPAHMLRHTMGKNSSGSQRGESFPMKVTRATETNNLDNPLLHEDYNRSYSPMEGKESEYHRHHNANDNRGYSSDPPSPPRFQGYVPSQSDKPPEYSATAADSLARPTSLNTQPGQIIFCSSIDQMKENMYRSMVPTLVIPAHYMRLPSEFSGKDGKDQKDQDKDGAQMGGGQQHHHHHSQKQGQQQHQGGSQGDDSEDPSWASDSSGGPVTIPVLFNDSTMAQMNGELQALTEKKLLELGVKQHPRAWFISLDGRANAHVRHSYIDVGNDLSGGGGIGFGGGSSSTPRDINLEPILDAQGRKTGMILKGKDERWGRKGHGVGSTGGKSYSKLAYPDHSEPSSSEGRPVSPEENSLTPLLDEGPSSQGSTIPRRGRSRVNSSRSSNSENRRDSMTSPEDDPDDKDENKKSPWQKIEDRPLMVFHPRK
ncbi:FAM171A2 isoform X2 protein [Solea senegalensis]|uniref:FAM171A2 isoform X2 protein n=1 Tax=Solea senegalensis TaxID=28829 RepID=A0AAV6SAI4_SOLSE|nr:protein FAM171A2 isoform X2 [Solea senegalensis]KAG7513928.1 FAM171A2 isoform X2 protein [Solea senegalensis]